MALTPKLLEFMMKDDDVELDGRKGILLHGCRYDCVFQTALKFQYAPVQDELDLWHICWTDAPLTQEKLAQFKRDQILGGINAPPLQKLNHFPGMYEICRKDRLARNLNRMKRLFPKEYSFFPLTWDLPSDMGDLLEFGKRHKGYTFIVKPDAGCQGKGIFLVRNLRLLLPFAKCVCQQYIAQPFLIDGFKYDQRIYVLITCVDPLRIYIYEEGLARFGTVKYQHPNDNNLDITYMHLTNYSLNRFSDSYDPDSSGSKRPLSSVYEWIKNRGYDVTKLLKDIDEVIVKTIICIAPSLRHQYRTNFPKREKGCYCFEMLGFDILIDRYMKPMLLEVNLSPSFNTETFVDTTIKASLVKDIFSMIYLPEEKPEDRTWRKDMYLHRRFNIHRLKMMNNQYQRPGTPHSTPIPDALKEQFAHEEKSTRNFRLIFTEDNPGKYAPFLDKEYSYVDSCDEDESFMRKRIEPSFIQETCSDSFHQVPKVKTTYRNLKNGDVYAESRTKSATNPQDFIRLKFNQHLNNNDSHHSSSHHSKRNGNKEEFSSEGTLIKRGAPRPVSALIRESVETLALRPSQRVKKALDQLRTKKNKNLKQFKAVTVPDDEITETINPTKSVAVAIPSRPEKEKVSVGTTTSLFHFKGVKASRSRKPVDFESDREAALVKACANVIAYSAPNLNIYEPPRFRRPSRQPHTPLPLDLPEESDRLYELTSRKNAVDVLGIREMAKKIVQMTSTVKSKTKQRHF